MTDRFNPALCALTFLLVVVMGCFVYGWAARTCTDAAYPATDGYLLAPRLEQDSERRGAVVVVVDEGPERAGFPLPPPADRVLFDALRLVESGGDARAVGDGGRSRGPYQIQLAYWTDGGGNPERYLSDVWDRAACEKIMIGYFERYCPAALASGDWQTVARVHNGGPNGMSKQATLGYWSKVKGAMERYGTGD